ncbi:MAG TPA: hypothetical protein VFE62_00140 [Gemmataceae bacterium]|nr:hypothetical protein [Gemmataceae bacterium]
MSLRTVLPMVVVTAFLGLSWGQGFANPNHANTSPKPKSHAPATKSGHANAKSSGSAHSGGHNNGHAFTPGFIPATGNAKTHTGNTHQAIKKPHPTNHASSADHKPQVINFPHHGSEKNATAHKDHQPKDTLAHQHAEHTQREQERLRQVQKELQQKEAQERARLVRLEADLARAEQALRAEHHHHHHGMTGLQGVRLLQPSSQQNWNGDDQGSDWSGQNGTNAVPTVASSQRHRTHGAYDYADQLLRGAIRHLEQAIAREKSRLARQEHFQKEIARHLGNHRTSTAPHLRQDTAHRAQSHQRQHEHPRLEASKHSHTAHASQSRGHSHQTAPKRHGRA